MRAAWKRLFRRVRGAVLALLVLLTAVVMAFAAGAGGVVVKLHYYRPDGDYDGWDVWLWAEGMEGAGHPFVEEDGEMVATLEVSPGVKRVGFIVRTEGWVKDVDADQYIDLQGIASGTVHVRVESGAAGYAMAHDGDAVTEAAVAAVRYSADDNAVTVAMTEPLTGALADRFELLDWIGQPVAVGPVTETGSGEYLLEPEEALNAFRSYRLRLDGAEYPVVMPNLYSTEAFEAAYTYEGNDLGATWTPEGTAFRVWAPTADAVTVNLYAGGTAGEDDLTGTLTMRRDVNGTWVAEKAGDLNGVYYTYAVTIGGQVNEACDPYARATGVNGSRAMVIDLAATDPEGWDADANPNAGIGYTDAVIYELHVRDLSSDASSGIVNAGKFLGLTERGTATPGGAPTGIDHIRNLGVTHVHLLPVYDFGSVDETRLDEPQFNWGYDPVNYNVPEGSYATDPYRGEVRVAEMKRMVMAFHESGLSVIMDVVYNHVYDAESFCFNQIVPGYFSRISDSGVYSNGSGCGNDTASERSMVRKYIVESVKYWADEYHIDGFRFDLVGLLDTQTVNEVVEEVHRDHPDVIFYGEGWAINTAVTKAGVLMATQGNSPRTPGFAYFNDTIRNALAGVSGKKGYVSGAGGQEVAIRQSVTGLNGWCTTPAQSVNYASCHDNHTLMDRIVLSTPNATREEQIRMNNLAAAICFTSQGIPFMQAGEEMLRTKPNPDGTFNENSYNAPDAVNSLKWSDLEQAEYRNVYTYYQGLIAFRKAHGALRLASAEDVRAHVTAVKGLPVNVSAFRISGGVNGETAEELFLIFNPTGVPQTIELPEGVWHVYVNGERAGMDILGTVTDGKVTVEPISAMALVRESVSP